MRIFQQHGFPQVTTQSVYVNRRGKATGNPNQVCVAFVKLGRQEEVDRAIQVFHQKLLTEVCWKPLHVQEAVPRMSTMKLGPAFREERTYPGDPADPDPYFEPTDDFQPTMEIDLNNHKVQAGSQTMGASVDNATSSQKEVPIVDLEQEDTAPWKVGRTDRHKRHKAK